MTTSKLLPGLLTVIGSLVGCTANIHDNVINIPDATVNATTTADVDNVAPEQMLPIALAVTNVYLVEPTATVPPEHIEDAGHVQIYLDDTAAPPLVVTAQATVMVQIPKATPAGKHKVLCRVHKHDGTPTSTMFELSITVKVTVTTAPDGGTTVNTTVTVDAGSTADAATAAN